MGMAIAHAQASGMGGMRTAGDLVARVQLAKGCRIREAKAYVAEKLGTSVMDLVDPVVMGEVRADKGLGTMMPLAHTPKGIECKFNIARELDVKINCLGNFLGKTGLGGGE
jgi:dimethylamine--corrinoid protein Co-methyltransferase